MCFSFSFSIAAVAHDGTVRQHSGGRQEDAEGTGEETGLGEQLVEEGAGRTPATAAGDRDTAGESQGGEGATGVYSLQPEGLGESVEREGEGGRVVYNSEYGREGKQRQCWCY